MTLMTKKEYAGLKGWSKAYLSKKTVKEKLVPAMVQDENGDWKIDSDIADQIFKATHDPARAHLRKGSTGDDPAGGDDSGRLLVGFEKSRAEREAIRVEEAKLNLAERKNELLSRAETIKAISSVGVAIREHLQARNRRIAEQASTMTSAREIKVMLDEDDRSMLEMLSDDLMRRISEQYPGSGDGNGTIN